MSDSYLLYYTKLRAFCCSIIIKRFPFFVPILIFCYSCYNPSDLINVTCNIENMVLMGGYLGLIEGNLVRGGGGAGSEVSIELGKGEGGMC